MSRVRWKLLRNSASSFHWLSSSILIQLLFVVPHPWHLLSSPLYDVPDHTNHIFSVRIWSWLHVSVIHCWVGPSLLLSSFEHMNEVRIVWIRTQWHIANSCQSSKKEILSPFKPALTVLRNSSLVSEFSKRRSASGHFCFISPSISFSQAFPPWMMLNGSILK